MLNFDGKTITALPMLLYFVRCVYAVVILIKMHVAVCIPNSELGKLFQAEDLQVEFYLNNLIDHISTVARQRSIRPNKVIRILKVLRDWFEEKHKKGITAQLGGGDALGSTEQDQDGRHGNGKGQSGLHMLSQVATGQQAQNGEASADWNSNFERANNMPYSQRYSTDPQSNASYTTAQDETPNFGMPNYGGGFGMHDPNMSQDYGWGDLGVQQAMDIALGDMNGLQGGGLDNWLLGGDSMMPFVSYDTNGPQASAMGRGF